MTSLQRKEVTPILGRADHADLPKLRKLYHEAYTVVAVELRQRLEEGTKKLMGARRGSSRQWRRRLDGLS